MTRMRYLFILIISAIFFSFLSPIDEVRKKYAETIRYMLSDVKNIKIVLLPESKSWRYIRLWRIFYKSIGYKILGLGSQGLNFFPPGVRFDQNFYDQAILELQ